MNHSAQRPRGVVLAHKREEAAPIRCRRESFSVSTIHVEVEEALWRCECDRGAFVADADGHELTVGREKVQLASVLSPDRPLATAKRDLPLAAAAFKRDHVDLIPSVFVGLIRNESAVRGEVRISIVGEAAKQQARRARALHR